MSVLKNPKHEAFAQNIAMGLQNTDAYLKAGYYRNTNPASNGAINLLSKRLKARPHVRARIAEIVAKAAATAEITVERVLHELAVIAFANIQDYLGVEDFNSLTRDQKAPLREVTVEELRSGDKVASRLVKYKLSDKQAALVDLGKHFGMFGPDFSIRSAVLINQDNPDDAALERTINGIVAARNDAKPS
jgi:phage terminase small subunit